MFESGRCRDPIRGDILNTPFIAVYSRGLLVSSAAPLIHQIELCGLGITGDGVGATPLRFSHQAVGFLVSLLNETIFPKRPNIGSHSLAQKEVGSLRLSSDGKLRLFCLDHFTSAQSPHVIVRGARHT